MTLLTPAINLLLSKLMGVSSAIARTLSLSLSLSRFKPLEYLAVSNRCGWIAPIAVHCLWRLEPLSLCVDVVGFVREITGRGKRISVEFGFDSNVSGNNQTSPVSHQQFVNWLRSGASPACSIGPKSKTSTFQPLSA